MAPFLPLVLLSACAPGISGIWLLQVQFAGEDAVVCDESSVKSHNFTGATEPSEDEEDASTLTRSDALILVQIEEGGDGTAVLVIEEDLYPGTESDDGWVFGWTTSVSSTDAIEQAVYSFTKDETTETTRNYKLTVDGDTLSGSLMSVDRTAGAYTETDQMAEAPDTLRPSIPASIYLVTTTPEGQSRPASNQFDVKDCDAELCELEVDFTCNTNQVLTGTRTGYDEASDYGGVGTAGQNPGGI